MASSKTTKRALVASAFAMLMCIAMLIGTTFAWFTDTASTSVNKIQSGNLDVQLYYANNTTGTDDSTTWTKIDGETAALQFMKASDSTEQEVLWEPGCTYSLPALKIANEGNLALKYKVIITGINGAAKLNDVIEWTIKNSADEEATDLSATEYHLTATGTENASNILTIKGHMKENAGNEYQGLSINGISITVIATQDTVEYDSTTNEYDKNAEYVPDLVTAAELKSLFVDESGALKSEVKLDKDYLLTDTWIPLSYWVSDTPGAPTSVTIDGQGHTIYNMAVTGTEKLGFISSNNITLSIKDLTFSNATVVGSNSWLGVVIGYQYGNVSLDNVQVVNSVVKSTAEKGIRIGGLVGFSALNDGSGNVALHLKNCSVTNSTFEGYHNTCGLVGSLMEYTTHTSQYSVTDCKVSGCSFLWGSPTVKYNHYAFVDGSQYSLTTPDAAIDGVTMSGNTCTYK